jgi:uncharacterized damage-inducible protein DinB
MGDHPLLELFRHKTWATLRLIEHCRGLDDEDLAATIPGTYGTIRETLLHLVESESGDHLTVTGVRAPDNFPQGGPATMDALVERITFLGPRWEALAADPEIADRQVKTRDGWVVPAAVPMSHAIHHAGEHRSHVLSILGARGLEVPNLDPWAYAEQSGQMRLDSTRKFTATVHTSRGDFVIDIGDVSLAQVIRFIFLAQDNFYDGLPLRRGGGAVVGISGSQLMAGIDEAPPGDHGDYQPVGRVASGLDVVARLQPGDAVRSIDVRTG